MTKLQELILQIVDDNAGGIKLVYLVSELFDKKYGLDSNLKVDDIMNSIKGINDIGILTYKMCLEKKLFRENYFIYRK